MRVVKLPIRTAIQALHVALTEAECCWYCSRAGDRERSGQRRVKRVEEGDVSWREAAATEVAPLWREQQGSDGSRTPGSAAMRLCIYCSRYWYEYSSVYTDRLCIKYGGNRVHQDGLSRYKLCIYRVQLGRRYRDVSCGGYYFAFVLDIVEDTFVFSAVENLLFILYFFSTTAFTAEHRFVGVRPSPSRPSHVMAIYCAKSRTYVPL